MTALEELIRQRIKKEGPMDIGAFMELAVSHYYNSRDPFGVKGDFVTAPEISQMFGEMLGVWAANSWAGCGRPGKFVFLECGPGRGTLMADMLRATKKVEGFHEAAQIVLLETSAALQQVQREALKAYDVKWIANLQDLLGAGPVILIANEFLDALPVRQETYQDGAWRERVVALDDQEKLVLQGDGNQIREFSPAREGFFGSVCHLLKVHKGAALFVDYGYDGLPHGDTLQAVKDHKYVDILDNIGEADITAHVDFRALAGIAGEEGLNAMPVSGQGDFLKALGIKMRAEMLVKNANETQKKDIEAALLRLTGDNEMGRLFKVLEISTL